MQKLLLTAGIAGMVALSSPAFSQAWSENFNNGLPAGWTLINNDGNTPNNGVSFVNNAWVARIKTNEQGKAIPGDSVMLSTSWYTPAGTSDDWLITPVFNVSGPAMIIKWEEKAFDQQYADGYQVLISTTGTAISDFTTTALTVSAANSSYTVKYVSLAAYAGQAIHVAFRNNSNDKYLLAIDNVEVLTPNTNDLGLTGVSPKPGAPTAYAKTGNSITLGGTAFNNSITPVTTFKVHYQQGNGPVTTDVISGVNIAPFASASFTCPTAYTMPSSIGDYPIDMWVELTGDVDDNNDSNSTVITAASFMPQKKIFVEEGTGTWCGWCPRGAVYMDSLYHTYPSSFSLAAVHNNDPMTLSAYDAFIGTKINGYPSVVIDRREVKDPSELIDVYNAENDYFGFADITLTDVSAAGFGYSVKATVKPAIDLSGDYRLALILTEDDVHGTGSTWAQSNYYSYASNNIPLTGAGHDWQSEDAHVPDSKMYYNFVARHVVPSPDGAANSLPATMTAGNTYDYTFTTTINPGYKRDKMRAVVVLIRNSDGAVLNSNNLTVPLGVSDVASSVDNMSLYPNPAINNVVVSLGLSESSKVSIEVTDAMGRTVSSIPAQSLAKGNHKINISTEALANGIYNVKLQTEKGFVTKTLSVVK